MSDHRAEDVAALRLELSSLRARQEVLADALAAAGDELEKLGPENERLRAALDEIMELGKEEPATVGSAQDIARTALAARGGDAA